MKRNSERRQHFAEKNVDQSEGDSSASIRKEVPMSMKFLRMCLVLMFLLSIISLLWIHIVPSSDVAYLFSKICLGIFFIVGGVAHFDKNWAKFLLNIMPSFLPFKKELIIISGIIEAGLGILVLFQRFTNIASWGIIATLIAIYPANINPVFSKTSREKANMSLLAALLRLPLQFVFLYWAYLHTQHF